MEYIIITILKYNCFEERYQSFGIKTNKHTIFVEFDGNQQIK